VAMGGALEGPVLRSRRAGYDGPMFRQGLILIGFIALAFAAAAVAGWFTDAGRGPWYESLRQPGATPPDWVFPVVWNTLYTLMGVGSYLLWRVRGFSGAPVAWACYFSQLALNASWSIVFFGGKRIDLALMVMALLDGAVLATIVTFRRHRPLAAGLLLPYLAWLGLASYLNLRLLMLNP